MLHIDAAYLQNHPRNKHIEFLPEPHEYYYSQSGQWNDKVKFGGVTGFLDNFAEMFDRDNIAKGVAYRDGKNVEDVLAEWQAKADEAIAHGNYVHDTLEHFTKTGEIRDEALVSAFVKSYESMGLTLVGAEWTIYDESIGRASSIDGNFVDQNGRFVIGDYKTNRDISKNFWDSYKNKTLLYPIHNLIASKYVKYSLQVAMYRRWIEQYYIPAEQVSNTNFIIHVSQDIHGAWKFSWFPALDLRPQIQLIYDDIESSKQYKLSQNSTSA
jgi:ATP-dependent exoDNAse (exonuclease V) beta subunit